LAAVQVASSKEAWGIGPLVVFAEQIHLYGLAAAASLFLALGLMLLTLLQLRLTRAEEAGQKAR
jgi:alpha-1,4-digalacturonate transport system permease protein